MASFKDDASAVDGLHDPGGSITLRPQTQAQSSQSIEALKDILYGSTAGILGKFVEYPFDTVKVRLQSHSHHSSTQALAGPLDAFAAAFRSPEGALVSLYRGISAPLVGAAVETSSLFFSYRVAQDLVIANTPSLREQREQGNVKVELPFSALLACGAASGAFTSLLLTPIELIKCKMQVPATPHMAAELVYSSSKPPGPLQLIRTVFRNHGLLGFWHGQLGTLIRETGGSAAWFGSYEGVKMLFLRADSSLSQISDVKVWQQMLAGAAAGTSYNFVFYPADTIKSRMQTATVDTVGAKQLSFVATGRQIWRDQGLRGYYRGCGITVFRAAPSSAIIFSIYEALRRYFG